VKKMRNALVRLTVIAMVLMMATASVATMAGAEDVQEDMDGLLEATETAQDVEMVEELSDQATTWQKGVEIIDADSDGNPESVVAAETGETAEGATWTRVVMYNDTDSDGNPDHLTAYEVAEDEIRKYEGAAGYVDADSDGNPELFQAWQSYEESDTRFAKRYLNYVDDDSDGIPELIEFYSVGQWDTLTWTAAAKLVDANSDGNPESFEAYQEVVLSLTVWGKRYLKYVDADSDGNPEDVQFYEEARFNRLHVVAYAHLVDADSDGNPELIEAARAARLGLVAIGWEGVKYVDVDSDGNPEKVEYFAMVLTDDGAAVRGVEYVDADSDGNPETIKALEGLKVDDELVAARAVELTDADSDGHPEKLAVLAWAISDEGKVIEAAEWVDADGDGNPESIKAYRHLETTSGVEVSQAFEYIDADSDGNPEKVTYYEIGKVTFEDEGVAAVVESQGDLPPMEDLSDVEPPSTDELELPDEATNIRQLDEVSAPWSGLDMQPWETEGGTAALLS
jgi:hypothetical protein